MLYKIIHEHISKGYASAAGPQDMRCAVHVDMLAAWNSRILHIVAGRRSCAGEGGWGDPSQNLIECSVNFHWNLISLVRSSMTLQVRSDSSQSQPLFLKRTSVKMNKSKQYLKTLSSVTLTTVKRPFQMMRKSSTLALWTKQSRPTGTTRSFQFA